MIHYTQANYVNQTNAYQIDAFVYQNMSKEDKN